MWIQKYLLFSFIFVVINAIYVLIGLPITLDAVAQNTIGRALIFDELDEQIRYFREAEINTLSLNQEQMRELKNCAHLNPPKSIKNGFVPIPTQVGFTLNEIDAINNRSSVISSYDEMMMKVAVKHKDGMIAISKKLGEEFALAGKANSPLVKLWEKTYAEADAWLKKYDKFRSKPNFLDGTRIEREEIKARFCNRYDLIDLAFKISRASYAQTAFFLCIYKNALDSITKKVKLVAVLNTAESFDNDVSGFLLQVPEQFSDFTYENATCSNYTDVISASTDAMEPTRKILQRLQEAQ